MLGKKEQTLSFRKSHRTYRSVEDELRYGVSKREHSRTAAESAKIRKLLPAFANFSVQKSKTGVVGLAKLYLSAKLHAI